MYELKIDYHIEDRELEEIYFFQAERVYLWSVPSISACHSFTIYFNNLENKCIRYSDLLMK